jgi:hypothetical protein
MKNLHSGGCVGSGGRAEPKPGAETKGCLRFYLPSPNLIHSAMPDFDSVSNKI